MIRKPHQSLLVKGWNCFSKIAPRNIMAPHLSTADVMEGAIKTAKTSDFGAFQFVDALSQLIHSIESTADLTPFGRFYVNKMLTGQLVHRLNLVAYLKKHPEILEQKIRSPLIILGMPRTGSSFLFNLLAQNPSHRYLHNWEAVVSQVPPPGPYNIENDPRRRMSKRLLSLQGYLAPGLRNMHDFSVDGPEECTPLLMQSFTLSAYGTMFNVPDYLKWLSSASRMETYQYHDQILKVLQWKYPGQRWLLKSPLHSDALEEIFAIYPDACVIHTHRDPAKCVPSYISLSAAFRGITTHAIDTAKLGQQTLDILASSCDRFSTQRKRIGSGRIMDVAYNDLTRDPLGTVQRIYQHFELTCSDELQLRIQGFISRDRTAKRTHHYKAQDFGIATDQIQERFGAYEIPTPLNEPVRPKLNLSKIS